MNMRVPLKAAAESMKNADKAGSEALGFIEFAEHTKNDIAYGMKKAVKQRPISAEEDTELFGNGEDAMTMNALDDFERHGSGTLDGVEVSAGRTETAFAAKRDKFERTTRRAPIHSSAVGRISAMNHLLDAFENHRASLKGVLDFFVMV